MKYKVVLRRVVGYPVLGLVAGVALLAIAALTPRKWSFSQTEPCEFTVYVSGDRFHTNFFVPVETSVYDWRDHLDLDGIAGSSSKDYHYLQFGWGDRIFYMETPSWNQVSPTNALRSLFFWQNASAMFVKGHSSVPHFANETPKCIRLGKTDYLALMNFIDASFQLDDQSHKQRIGNGQDQQSGFYAANGYYSVLKTCNSWTADGLRAANVNTPLWGGLATPVMHHLRNGCECNLERMNDEG